MAELHVLRKDIRCSVFWHANGLKPHLVKTFSYPRLPIYLEA